MGLGVCDYERSAAINVHPSVTFLIQGASDTMLFCNPEAQRELLDWGKVFFFFFRPGEGFNGSMEINPQRVTAGEMMSLG